MSPAHDDHHLDHLNSGDTSSEPGRQPILVMRDVNFSFDQIPVLIDVNLAVYAKETITIVGPNGGGKTTLLKLILGLYKPLSGAIEVFGMKPEKARIRIGYSPQQVQFDAHFPITVRDVVLMGRLSRGDWHQFFGWFTKADKTMAMQALDEVGMANYAHRQFSALSGGQRQRVLIARALACNPELLLLDEPMANVDTVAEAKLLEILDRLRTKMAILMVSHDLTFVSSIVKRVICVNREVRLHGASELTSELMQELYGCDLHIILHDNRVTDKESHDV